MEKYNLTQTGAEVQEILNNATPQSELTAEVERAQGTEQTLQGNIDAEELRAKAAEHDLEQADTVLQGNIDAEELRAKAAEKQNADDIDVIEEKIPTEASSSNQLADKAFVNSSIASNTATYRGSFNQVNDLHLTLEATEADIATALASAIDDADNNDYCYLQVPVSESAPTEIAQVDRYKFNGTTWAYEYTLNNSGFTADQWAALNSAITSGLVAKLSALPNMAELTALLAGKQNLLNFDTAPTTGSNNPVTSGGVKTAIDDEKTRAQAAEQANNLLITQINGKIPSDATSENKLVDKAYVDAADATMQSAIEGILALIPEAATALNQLADKAFVNSSIATNTGTFKGTYNVVLDLELFYDATHAQIALMLASKISSAKNNDYCYVQVPNSNEAPTSINHTDRYKYNGTAWAYEYTLNNSGYTSDQWSAINSGITSALVTSLTNLLNNLVPSTATAQNKLADQAYVIAAIVAAIPACKGTFTTLSDLEAVASPKAGDLGIVRTTDSNGYAVYTFYQYINNAWTVFFEINHQLINKPASDNTELATFDNGMGKYEIPKHIVNIGTELEPIYQNQLHQSDFQINGSARTNTIYVIKYDFTLAEDITIPANCVLQFDGGSIAGEYVVTLNNTKLIGTDCINCQLSGSIYNNTIEASIFKSIISDYNVLTYCTNVADIIKLKNDKIYSIGNNTLTLSNKTIYGNNATIEGNNNVLILSAEKIALYDLSIISNSGRCIHTSDTLDKVIISGCYIESKVITNSVYCIITSAPIIHIYNSEIVGGIYGLYIGSTKDLTIDNCCVHGCGEDGIVIQNSNQGSIFNNNVYNVGRNGITVLYSSFVNVHDNYIHDWDTFGYGHGICLSEGAQYIKVSNNKVYLHRSSSDDTGCGITADLAIDGVPTGDIVGHNEITNNIIDVRNLGNALYINKCHDSILFGNVVSGGFDKSIFVWQTYNTVVQNNTITLASETKMAAIADYDSDNIVIAKNTIIFASDSRCNNAIYCNNSDTTILRNAKIIGNIASNMQSSSGSTLSFLNARYCNIDISNNFIDIVSNTCADIAFIMMYSPGNATYIFSTNNSIFSKNTGLWIIYRTPNASSGMNDGSKLYSYNNIYEQRSQGVARILTGDNFTKVVKDLFNGAEYTNI